MTLCVTTTSGSQGAGHVVLFCIWYMLSINCAVRRLQFPKPIRQASENVSNLLIFD